MAYLQLIIFGILLLCSTTATSFSAGLLLDMPNGQKMGFQQICIGDGASLFASHKFRMGEPNGGFKESPTIITVGGSFPIQKGDATDWCYYLGESEVTEAQFYSLMKVKNEKDREKLVQGTFPVTDISWFDAIQFINAFNQWIYKHSISQIPSFQEAKGFLRLPTEEEWEYAARGGKNVSEDDFDKRYVYPKRKLAAYEWFAGPKSSHNKKKQVKILKPNPLGLYDMLGNVAEMTINLYKLEYFQGRTGGFVARGGHHLTSEKQLRSSARSEQPFYIWDKKRNIMRPNTQKTLGFRLALATILYPNRTITKKMAASWSKYRKNSGSRLPAAISTAPVNQQLRMQFDDALTHINRLKKVLSENRNLDDTVVREIGFLEASISKTGGIRKQAALDSAKAWITILSERALNLNQQARNLKTFTKLQEAAQNIHNEKKQSLYKLRIKEINTNIQTMLVDYSSALRQLEKLGKEATQNGIEEYNAFLKNRNAIRQINMMPLVKKHIQLFLTEKRANKDLWKTDLFSQDLK